MAEMGGGFRLGPEPGDGLDGGGVRGTASHLDLGDILGSSLVPAQPRKGQSHMRCCCGRTGCIYLEHNCSVLASVENDVRTAAKLGQSLLERHEAYMADAERDRAELIQRIGRLEMDKKELEVENARKIEENRALLDQLESLNTTVSDSDTHIKMLEATLQSSQQIIRRLEGAAERAEDMERHLAALEAEQAVLQNNIVTTESEARSAIQRWKRAERGIADLQYQLEKMEKEAHEERERHLEVVERLERQRALDQQLSSAAVRLKGAAVAKSLQQTGHGHGHGNNNGTVTHFVRDLLQDNANLQLGMAELRQMLMNSNDEIQMLRDQLTYHQPLAENNHYNNSNSNSNNATSAASTLRAELEMGEMPGSPELEARPGSPALPAMPTLPPTTPYIKMHRPSGSQEVHIHHHYHVSTKKPELKKPKKKRLSLTPGIFTPPSICPGTPLSRSRAPSIQYDPLSTSPLSFDGASRHGSQHMSRDSVSTALSGPSTRWSVFSDQPSSDFGNSSVPSSPRTNPRSSVFDRTLLSDLSLPSSPATSLDPLSPYQQQPSSRAGSLNDALVCGGYPPPLTFPAAEPIAEDDETLAEGGHLGASNAQDDVPDFVSNTTGRADDSSAPSEATTPIQTPIHPTQVAPPIKGEGLSKDDEEEVSPYLPRRTLHRSVSHESIVSLQGGLDIHTLKARPSQLILRPLGTATANIGLSSVTAQPVISRGAPDMSKSNAMLRDSLSLRLSIPPRSTRVVSNPATTASTASSSLAASATARLAATSALTGSRKFGMLVGWRPWGGGSGTSAPIAKSAATTASVDVTVGADQAVATTVDADTPSKEEAEIKAPDAADVPAKETPALEISSAAPPEPSTDLPAVAAPPSGPEAAVAAEPAIPAQAEDDTAAATKPNAPHRTPNAKSIMRDRQGMRSPGINQPGAIPGFLEYWAAHQRRGAPSKVRPDTVDQEALQEVLEGE